jgi:hypothetical protein
MSKFPHIRFSPLVLAGLARQPEGKPELDPEAAHWQATIRCSRRQTSAGVQMHTDTVTVLAFATRTYQINPKIRKFIILINPDTKSLLFKNIVLRGSQKKFNRRILNAK